ncbi:MAG TPA: hypothetical protein VNS09_17680 [Solirubrobacter sp.]|nr:hypothetical protein [Solirubrobacter sp.]
MPIVSVHEELERSDSMFEFATRLGRSCLDEASRLTDLLGDPEVHRDFVDLEATVAALGAEPDFRSVLDGSAGVRASLMESLHPVDHLAVLRGLCTHALPHFFERIGGQVPLDRGAPVPLVSRPINAAFATTPHHPTLRRLDLMYPLAFALFEPPHVNAEVVLDYTVRDRLDALTWSDRKQLPRVATLHPVLTSERLTIGEIGEDTFFGVTPSAWDLEALLAQLHSVRDVEIAVLPELCLPTAGALDDALSAEPARYPPVVVSGSAHVVEGGTRANESRVYLDGRHVATHRKIVPYATKTLDGRTFAQPVAEAITGERKRVTVLSGTHTRLAVVICADLNSLTIPGLLEQAGVNLLLVPALTPSAGAFNGALCQLASHCQAVSVVVNAELAHDDDGDTPFLVMAAVPRPTQQSRVYPDALGQRGSVGVVDPNQPLDRALTWRS